MLAPVQVNGAGPFAFVLDTASSVTVLDTALVEELGLAGEGFNILVHGITGSVVAPAYRPVAIGLGDEAIASASVVALDFPAVGGARGILGVDVLAQRVVEFDGPAKLLRLSRAPYAPPASGAVTRATIRRDGFGLPHVPIEINGTPGLALLDTGLPGVVVDPALATRAHMVQDAAATGLTGVADASSDLLGTGNARLNMGPIRWFIWRAALVRPSVLDRLDAGETTEAILGAAIFEDVVLVVDLGRQEAVVVLPQP